MIKSFFWNKKWAIWAWGGLAFLLASLYAQVHMTVLLNEWYRGFYDILQGAGTAKYSISDFWQAIIAWSHIAVKYVLLAAVTAYFTRLYAFSWREAMTFGYLPRWEHVDEQIEGAAQRIQQDTERFARIVETLGLQIARAIMTLIAFLPILWSLSQYVVVELLKDMEGSLVWAAMIVSLGGMLISWFVGIKLPGLEYNNQVVEAAYRQNLELISTKKIDYNFPKLAELFTGVRFNYRRLYLHYGYFDLWVYFYDVSMGLVPYLVMAPGLFTGVITLGVMMQIANAFDKVHASFSLFVHRWTTVTELRSIRKRLHEFEANLKKHEKREGA